jgi:hypothetical protein
LAQGLGERAQGVQIIAEDLDRDLGADARQKMIQPVGDRLPQADRRRQRGESGADIGEDLFASALAGAPPGMRSTSISE